MTLNPYPLKLGDWSYWFWYNKQEIAVCSIRKKKRQKMAPNSEDSNARHGEKFCIMGTISTF